MPLLSKDLCLLYHQSCSLQPSLDAAEHRLQASALQHEI